MKQRYLHFNYIKLSFPSHGLIPLPTRPGQAHPNQERDRQPHLLSLPHVRYPPRYSGWRIYMEDAHLSESPIPNSKNSLFGVFDGHGGTPLVIQAQKSPSSSNDTSAKNLKSTKIINPLNTSKPSAKPS